MATATTIRTLPMARSEFIAALNRDTGKTERPRFLEVLDALIAWSVARPDRLRFRNDETKQGVISFERVGSNVVFWSVHPRRGADPTIEFIPRSGSVLTETDRAEVMNALNAHSREALTKDDKLRIGFGALKNQAARAAILGMMDQLLLVT